MSTSLLQRSNELADAVDAAAPSVVQVHGRRAPASGIVFDADLVLTTVRAAGRDEGLRVRTPDGRTIDAELAGWDLTTHVAVLRVPDLGAPSATLAASPARVGHLALAIGRSWSNAVTASAGLVAIIGGPLPTGPRRAIDQVIRTTAPMHRGFAGGAFVDVSGGLLGVITAAEIRGFRVVIPAAIAWAAARDVLQHGRPRRGFLGVAGQSVRLAAGQRETAGRDDALLISAVVSGSPAERAGVLVGDLLLAVDDVAVDSAEHLIDLLTGDRVGREVALSLLRGGRTERVAAAIEERTADRGRAYDRRDR
jgi:S1-C subfamily serine protease